MELNDPKAYVQPISMISRLQLRTAATADNQHVLHTTGQASRASGQTMESRQGRRQQNVRNEVLADRGAGTGRGTPMMGTFFTSDDDAAHMSQ